MIEEQSLNEMKDTEEKQLLVILKENGKPVLKKVDGYAAVMDEDKQIDYKDYEGNERTLKVPKGSVVFCEPGSNYPKVITGDDFEKKYKFLEEKKAKKEEKKSDIGIESIMD